MHLRRVFQRRRGQEHAGRSLVTQNRVGQSVRINLVHIGVVVEPEVARVESRVREDPCRWRRTG